MDFKLLGNVKDTKEVCPTHDIPLVQFRDKKLVPKTDQEIENNSEVEY